MLVEQFVSDATGDARGHAAARRAAVAGRLATCRRRKPLRQPICQKVRRRRRTRLASSSAGCRRHSRPSGGWPPDLGAGPPLDATMFQIEHQPLTSPGAPWVPVLEDDNLTTGDRAHCRRSRFDVDPRRRPDAGVSGNASRRKWTQRGAARLARRLRLRSRGHARTASAAADGYDASLSHSCRRRDWTAERDRGARAARFGSRSTIRRRCRPVRSTSGARPRSRGTVWSTGTRARPRRHRPHCGRPRAARRARATRSCCPGAGTRSSARRIRRWPSSGFTRRGIGSMRQRARVDTVTEIGAGRYVVDLHLDRAVARRRVGRSRVQRRAIRFICAHTAPDTIFRPRSPPASPRPRARFRGRRSDRRLFPMRLTPDATRAPAWDDACARSCRIVADRNVYEAAPIFDLLDSQPDHPRDEVLVGVSAADAEPLRRRSAGAGARIGRATKEPSRS